MSDYTDAELFNCCTDYREPDWSRYSRLEIGACKLEGTGHFHDGEEDNITIGGLPFDGDDVEFFTVYGRNPDDEAEAITDIPGTMCDALAVAIALGKRSGGLPIYLYNYA